MDETDVGASYDLGEANMWPQEARDAASWST